MKVEKSNHNPNDAKVLAFKKEAETSLLQYCHTFLKSCHLDMHLFEVLYLEKVPLKYAFVQSTASLKVTSATKLFFAIK